MYINSIQDSITIVHLLLINVAADWSNLSKNSDNVKNNY
jgi:hypothetical protein